MGRDVWQEALDEFEKRLHPRYFLPVSELQIEFEVKGENHE